jgi:hypothetical protein
LTWGRKLSVTIAIRTSHTFAARTGAQASGM